MHRYVYTGAKIRRERLNTHKRRYRQLRRLWLMYPDVSARFRLWIITDEWIIEDTKHYRRREGVFDIRVEAGGWNAVTDALRAERG